MARKKGSEGSGIVWCHGRGNNCIAFEEIKPPEVEKFSRFFAKVDKSSSVFDPALGSLSDTLNKLVNETQAKEKRDQHKDDKLQIGFLVTGAGFLPVWKREVEDNERLADLVDIKGLTDLDAMTFDQLKEHLRIQSDNGKDGEWRRHSTSGGVIRCRGGGKSCFVTVMESEMSFNVSAMSNFFPKVEQGSRLYDAALGEMATKLNTLVNEAQNREKQKPGKDPRIQIGLVITNSGFLPVWKLVTDEDDPPDATDLDAMTIEQRDQFLKVS